MARGKITLVFDGSQNHKIDYEWLAEHAAKFGMPVEDYAHLGLLMLKLVEDKVLVSADDDPMAPTAPPPAPEDQLTDDEKAALGGPDSTADDILKQLGPLLKPDDSKR
jgi:hypothetical protein